MTSSQRWLDRILPWIVPVALIGGWQLAVEAGWLSNRILPAPSAVVEAFWTLAKSGDLWQNLKISTFRGFAARLYHRAFPLGRAPARQFPANVAQYSPSGADPAGDFVVRH